MASTIRAWFVDKKKKYFEFAGLSTEEKPTSNLICTGSLFHEVDTKKIYAYNEAAVEWVEQMQLSEDTAAVASALSAPLNVPRINFGSLNTANVEPDAEPETIEEEVSEEEPEEELDEVPQDGEEE